MSTSRRRWLTIAAFAALAALFVVALVARPWTEAHGRWLPTPTETPEPWTDPMDEG
jgi:hypothetical protein